MTDQRRFAVVILAAGQGTRMRSDTHKVLHPIASRPVLLHLLDRVDALGADKRVVVVGKGREQVEAAIAGRKVDVAVQAEQKGTGHAVQQAQGALAGYDGPVLVLYADTPFVEADTLRRMIDRLNGEGGPGVVVLASRPDDPLKYGRIILGQGDRIARMVEYKDATEEERAVRLCNSGMMAVRAADLFRWLGKVGNDNAAGEFYLPDIVNIAAEEGREAVVIEGDPYEAAGVNSRAELAHLELEWQRRRREQVLDEGATLIDPESVWFAYDTKLGRDVTVEPHVVFGPGVSIADGATIHAFSHIEGAIIGAKASIGPFARIRPGTTLGDKTKVGNFVELKKPRSRPGPRSIICPTSATPRSAPQPISARGPSPAITTASANIARRLARAPSSAPTPRWLHRSGSAPAPLSVPGRSSPATLNPTAWRSNGASSAVSPAGPSASANA
jgi:bifunctional UDP-N-acetylglucosamine pyrophosphorylase/glucosamine-1-phosphate N-acetyltransferase